MCTQQAVRKAPAPLLPLWASRAAEPTAPADHNIAVDSNGQYVPTVTAAPASHVKAALSKAAW